MCVLKKNSSQIKSFSQYKYIKISSLELKALSLGKKITLLILICKEQDNCDFQRGDSQKEKKKKLCRFHTTGPCCSLFFLKNYFYILKKYVSSLNAH